MTKKRRDDIPISLRLEPRRRYLLDLLARTQHRTMTGVIEAAITEESRRVELGGKSLFDMLEELWAAEEAERLARLAICSRYLLKTDEDAIWEVVLKSSIFWKESSADASLSNLNLEKLIDEWDALKKHVAEHGTGKPFHVRVPPPFTIDEGSPFGNFDGN